MSGILNGDSIYKSGGGVGGYKDGGALVDGDFIKVENNNVYNYENINRDQVNFYFDYSDGEIFNSIIEFTTQVNSVVNVYVVKNGFYYLLGVIGSNTVQAGEDYKVNITDNSYIVDKISGGGTTPEYADIAGTIYGICKIGGQLWTTSNLKLMLDTNCYVTPNGEIVYSYVAPQQINDKVGYTGFRVPNYDDYLILKTNVPDNTDLRSLSSWYDNRNGNGNTRFNAIPFGECALFSGSAEFYSNTVGKSAHFMIDKYDPGHSNDYYNFYIRYDNTSMSVSNTLGSPEHVYSVRLVKYI